MASVRPGIKGTFNLYPLFLAAFSTATHPPRTIKSARETFFFLESKNITYRVHAGDAVSRRYTLESRERPQVVQYEKTYVFTYVS